MPYDSSYPATGIKLKSAEMRAQFTGLKELINAIPAGPARGTGNSGADWSTRPVGPAGGVSMGQLQSAINAAVIAVTTNSSANTYSIATLDVVFSDPPTLADLEAVRAKLNEFILGARR